MLHRVHRSLGGLMGSAVNALVHTCSQSFGHCSVLVLDLGTSTCISYPAYTAAYIHSWLEELAAVPY